MKKIAILVIAVMLFISPFVAASTMTVPNNTQSKTTTSTTAAAFTHAVFIEEGTTTWCPNCPNAAEALYSLYESGEYPFYFVALVIDQNSVAQDRFWGHYRGKAIPTIFFDGGFNQTVGSGTTPGQTELLYTPLLVNTGERTVHPLELNTTVVGHNDAKLDITITVKNTGSKPYFGFVRSYVTEIESRWKNYHGDPYHFGFLDYAIKKIVFLGPEKSKTYTMTWDGAAKHGNLTFADIDDNNIMVIASVAHWVPHIVGADPDNYIGTHFAFYVDQTTGALVES
jgi:thiol-disulfide isomerase/thioredoxin